jgi:hypothetical protein
MDLTQPLIPLTPRQRAVAIAVAIVCALSRFAAMARTPWDWDEILLCLGMRSYDVGVHHPHPPGFPVYIAAGRIARLVFRDDFRALQSINLLAGILLFPAMFLLARELRFRFETALVAAALCAFFPNVWFFGGTAFSDVPSLTLVVFAVALLLRGCRSANAYLTGTLLLALAVGIRPQNFAVGLFPGALATWYRWRVSWRDVVFAALIGTVIVVTAFGAAMIATGGVDPYMSAIHAHAEYISSVDSYQSPDRPPLWRLFDRFFIKQYGEPVLSVIVSLFVAISLASAIRSRDRRVGILLLTFGPFAFMAWLMLDRFSVSRFSIGYCSMFAILAADGMARVSRENGTRILAIGGAVVIAFAVWMLPALAPVRNDVSPPVAAVEAVRKHLKQDRDDLFVGLAMTPFADYFLPDYSYHRVLDERGMPLSLGKRTPWLLTEIDRTRPQGFLFHREQGRLWKVARRHYFDVALEPVLDGPVFVSGWYQPERSGTNEWRWMSGRSVTKLRAVSGRAMLRLAFDIPDEVIPRPAVTVRLNGAVVDRIVGTAAHVSKDYELDSAPDGAPNILELVVDRTLNPARSHIGTDGRELGLLVRYLSWKED